MQCTKPIRIFPKRKAQGLLPSDYPDGLLVPCGKCLACRIKKREEWSLRMLHEIESHEDSIFLTLTYDDAHLPICNSLCPQDLQKFFKRLRKLLSPYRKNDFPSAYCNRSIKYFACGEYGDTTHRPHYHAIIFGLSLRPEDKQLVINSWSLCDWKNPKIKKNSFGIAEADSIRYVAQYIDKQIDNEAMINADYPAVGRFPQFKFCSMGLGKDFALKHKDVITKNLSITHRGKPVSIPRYYIKKLDIDSSLLREKGIERDIKVVEHYSGNSITADDLYMSGMTEDYLKYDEGLKTAKSQHNLNLLGKINLRQKKL
ncbi:MAG: replication initiator protein [Arizlama microvirus]|nr:MAG: replication initiator protein [Arizlama microvirus]